MNMNMIKTILLSFLLVGLSSQAYGKKHKGTFFDSMSHDIRFQYLRYGNEEERRDDSLLYNLRYLGALEKKVKKFSFHTKFYLLGNKPSTGPSNFLNTKESVGDFGFYEAYVDLKINRKLTFSAGVMPIEIGDGSVFHINDYYDVPTSFGNTVALKYERKTFTLKAYSVLTDYNPATSVNTKNMLRIFSYDHKKLPKSLSHLNVHYLMDVQSKALEDNNAGRTPLTRHHLAGSLGGKIKKFDYRSTYAMQRGEALDNVTKIDVDAYMYDAEVGFNLKSKRRSKLRNTRVYVGYHKESGDKGLDPKANYNPYFYDRHNRSGMMDKVSWGENDTQNGLSNLSAGVTTELRRKKITLGAHYNQFSLDEEAFGKEIDLVAGHKYKNGMMSLIRVGYFMPEADDRDSFYELEAQLKWMF